MEKKGSSPHTRDKFKKYLTVIDNEGIIPAYAGQILFHKENAGINKDHPRIRGTNATFNMAYAPRMGSSPHTRDKLQNLGINPNKDRIIPAYAGQMLSLNKSL